MNKKPNIVFLLTDQLRASSLPVYGETQIKTPNINKLASQGVTLTNAISSCPVCTPSRAMLVTGRHPQTTGHLINSVKTRHSELSIADAFGMRGYKTGWVGKWHLHTGVWPALNHMPNQPDWVPEGRDRLGFEYWRAYNQHMVYFNGFVHGDDWNYLQWDGYETDGLLNYGREMMDEAGNDPFCLFISPHQPHFTPYEFAPEHYYDRIPQQLVLPKNVPPEQQEASLTMYRHYLAMVLAIDDMVGHLLDYLETTGRSNNTIVVLTSDHGTQAGAHGVRPWQKKYPYEESIRIPAIIRYPGVIIPGSKCDALTAMPDFFPSLCGLAEIPVPRSVEGYDLSGAWLGKFGSFEQDAILTMNFSQSFDWFTDGMEWRGLRTKRYSYAKWLNGKTELYDLEIDPLQMNNLSEKVEHHNLRKQLEMRMAQLQTQRGDKLVPCTQWKNWLDNQRRVVRNAYGELNDPENSPDWSLLH